MRWALCDPLSGVATGDGRSRSRQGHDAALCSATATSVLSNCAREMHTIVVQRLSTQFALARPRVVFLTVRGVGGNLPCTERTRPGFAWEICIHATIGKNPQLAMLIDMRCPREHMPHHELFERAQACLLLLVTRQRDRMPVCALHGTVYLRHARTHHK